MIIKKEQLVLYTPLCIALILHVLLVLCLFFIKEQLGTTSLFTESAPVVWDEQGEAGTARGTPEGTEIVKESYEPASTETATPSDALAQEQEVQEAEESTSAEPAVLPSTPDIAEQQLPRLLEPAATPTELPRGHRQPDVPVQYAPPTTQESTTPKPRRRAAWHAVSDTARARAQTLNINKHVRTFTDQQYDAYGSPDGTGGSSDHGTGTGGGGNAVYHANINSLDLIKQSYIRKVIRAIVAQSNFLQIITSSEYPIDKVTTWYIEIGAQSKIKKTSSNEPFSPAIDDALRKILYSTQLPPLPSRLKDGFLWQVAVRIRQPGGMGPLILTADTN